ncbi:MAG: fimbrial protein [Bacteroides sp.]|uniref:fimbrial protein n=1 Tax=Bacteroides sp. TaxID=29523 RepID=UPI002FCAC51F
MKTIYYTLISLLVILLGACTVDEETTPEIIDGAPVVLRFTVDTPPPTPVSSRAINENQINSLYLLVFDENGRFLYRTQATANAGTFTATLTQSRLQRTVHFIANYDWSTFSDAVALGKDQGEVVASLQTTALVFWQQVVLTGGLSSTSFASTPVALIRNMAKYTLTNSATTLTNVTFAVYNKPSIGTVAPFNAATRTFGPYVTEPVGVTYTTNDTFGAGPFYSFERKNSTVQSSPTFVIVQGTYAGAVCYYKIDLVDNNYNMYDIARNTWFSIQIQSVTLAGYSTIAAAIASPASNNIVASVLVQSYPTISDGVHVLSVDQTTISFIKNGQTLNALATYKTVAGVMDNSTVVITLVQDPSYPLINGDITYNRATGAITGAVNDVPSNGAARYATIKVQVGYLSRTIQLRLHAPFQFSDISLNPNPLAAAVGTAATLNFTIPAEAAYLLPINVNITSAYLTPPFGNIKVIYENGVYKYQYTATSTGPQSISFTTNTATAAETILLEAPLFATGQVAYTNTGGVNRFSNVTISPYRVNFGTGQSVVLSFTTTTAGTFQIHTNNLTPVSGTISGGIYTYIATSPGVQTIAFTTNKQNIGEIIQITSPGYTTYQIPLQNQLVTVSGTLTFGASGGSGSAINVGVVTISVNGSVVNIIKTTATGGYTSTMAVNLGDVLTYSYTASNGNVYTNTVTVTAAIMTSTMKLIR